MPSTSDDMRALMKKWFNNDGSSDTEPLCFLFDRGWTDRAGLLTPPVPSHRASPYELKCVLFLCEEWDYAYEGMWGWDHETFVRQELEK